MPLFIHDLDPVVATDVQRQLGGAHDTGIVLCHPFHRGIDSTEIQTSILKTGMDNGLSAPADNALFSQMFVDYQAYLNKLWSGLSKMTDPVGFAFLAVGDDSIDDPSSDQRILRHAAFFEEFDPRKRTWVIIPTRSTSPDPIVYRDEVVAASQGTGPLRKTDFDDLASLNGAWDYALGSMSALGLREAWGGGCYLLTYGGEPMPISGNVHDYGCVNHVLAAMSRPTLFRFAAAAFELSNVVETMPGMPGSVGVILRPKVE
jgi:hypothetical protein